MDHYWDSKVDIKESKCAMGFLSNMLITVVTKMEFL